MKKIASILAIAFLTTTIFAQSLIPIKYGFKVGSNISNINSTANEGVKNIETSSQIGIAGGFYMEIALNDKWYIKPELIYSQKGASFTYEYTHDYDNNNRDLHNTSHELKLAYVELNPIISYKANDKFSLNFGPAVSFILTPDYDILIDKGENDDHSELPEGTYIEETIDVGLNLGLSYYLTDKFLINSRVNSSLMKAGTVSKITNSGLVNETPTNSPEINIYEIKNSIISFSIAYLF
jgi:long-subunit fatty acid transport protein|tara:strand:+ start:428 stop:1141 length:714 start_codon:yes stop_codon:yes gene_type:complete